MADNNLTTRRGELGQDFMIDEIDLRRRSLENALPSHFVEEYPEFISFMQAYYDFLDGEDGLDKMVERLRDVRNPDIARDEFGQRLVAEYGPDFPSVGAMTDANALKIFELWYESKGNRDAMEAYFRLFLNTTAEVIYPKDNMLRVSDGNWDTTGGRYLDQQGHLSETTMVVQDSNFYQIYSYMIRSGVSIADWGPQFRQIAHPAGWNLFGEVRIEYLAQFEQFRAQTRSGTRSPMIIPGLQTTDANRLILISAIYFTDTAVTASPVPHSPAALIQFIKKSWVAVPIPVTALTLEDVNKNLLVSTYTLGGIGEYTLGAFLPSVAEDTAIVNQRPVRIITENLVANGSFLTDTSSWTLNDYSNGSIVVTGGALVITETTDGEPIPRAYQDIGGLVVGETYLVWADVFGTADVKAGINIHTSTGSGFGDILAQAISDNSGVLERVAVTFVATATTHTVILYPNTSTDDGAVATFNRICIRKLSVS